MRSVLAAFGLAALLVANGSSVTACTASSDGATQEGDLTTDAVKSKEALFDEDMLLVRIDGWDGDPDDLKNQRDEVRLGAPTLSIFKTRASSDQHCPSAKAEGNVLFYTTNEFSLRTSGNLTNGTPKSSFKLDLDAKDDRLFGMKSLNLKSMWNDPSQMREALAWQLFEEAGVAGPKHGYAKLCVEGKKGGQPFTKYLGLYSLLEQVDKAFAKDRFGKQNDAGNLYKAYHFDEDVGPATLGYRSAGGDDSGKQYARATDMDARTYQLKTNDKDEDPPALRSYDDLATLARTLHGIPAPGAPRLDFASPEYAASVEGVFAAKSFLRWAAANALMGAWDNYWATQANYYLYDSGRAGAGADFVAQPYFTWVPWDYDNSFGIAYTSADWARASVIELTSYDGRTSAMAKLPAFANLLQNPTFFAYYLDAVEHFAVTLFTVEHVGAILARVQPRIERAAFLEGDGSSPAHTGRQFTNDEVYRHDFQHEELRRGDTFVLGIEHFVRIRHDAVKAELAKVRAARGVAKGASGATFDAKPDPLPR